MDHGPTKPEHNSSRSLLRHVVRSGSYRCRGAPWAYFSHAAFATPQVRNRQDRRYAHIECRLALSLRCGLRHAPLLCINRAPTCAPFTKPHVAGPKVLYTPEYSSLACAHHKGTKRHSRKQIRQSSRYQGQSACLKVGVHEAPRGITGLGGAFLADASQDLLPSTCRKEFFREPHKCARCHRDDYQGPPHRCSPQRQCKREMQQHPHLVIALRS